MLQNHSLDPRSAASRISLEGMDEAALLKLRAQLDDKLQVEIRQINLTEELGLQYRAGKLLLEETQNDPEVPANQKAQVFNSVNSMLASIVKMQESIYSMERLKRYETAFLKALETLPKEGKEAFFDLYGTFLADKGA